MAANLSAFTRKTAMFAVKSYGRRSGWHRSKTQGSWLLSAFTKNLVRRATSVSVESDAHAQTRATRRGTRVPLSVYLPRKPAGHLDYDIGIVWLFRAAPVSGAPRRFTTW